MKKFNLPTPGRVEDEESETLSNLSNAELDSRAALILEAIGGKANISSIDACITRIRVSAKDAALVNEAKLNNWELWD
ncbi:glucose PTS transporter subunit EIIB [Clostridium thermarum]|uniref:glucose PTS transporter subunit EIIB n=1 Tax=Clostridium thermarum TaxID=1716543 RepID=UPI0013CFD3B1